jgi:hypothetical protein
VEKALLAGYILRLLSLQSMTRFGLKFRACLTFIASLREQKPTKNRLGERPWLKISYFDSTKSM